jgi:hypothetical protein
MTTRKPAPKRKAWPIRTAYMASKHRPSAVEASERPECWFSSEDRAEGSIYEGGLPRRKYRVYEVRVRQVVTSVRLTRAELKRERRRAGAGRRTKKGEAK